MLRIKSGPTGARISGIKPEALVAVFVCSEVYASHGLDFVWTCGLDSKHMAGSLHYVGLAIDGGLPPDNLKAAIMGEIESRLGDDYDVVEEPSAEGGPHVHIEFQPKRPMS